MKRSLLFSASVAILLFALGRELAGAEEAKAIGKLPPAIEEFYANHNYVATFSTQEERAFATAGGEVVCKKEKTESNVEKRGDSIIFTCEVVRSKPNAEAESPRLKKIFHSLVDIEKRVLQTDPGIYRNAMMPIDFIVRNGPFEIDRVRCGTDRISVEVTLYPLGADTQARFIADYDSGTRKNVPSADELRSLSPSDLLTRKEIHSWILIDGQWMKYDADLVLLRSKSSNSPLGECN